MAKHEAQTRLQRAVKDPRWRYCNAQRRWDPFDAMSLLAIFRSCFPCFDCCTAALGAYTCLSGVSIWLAMCATTFGLASWQSMCKQTGQRVVARHVDMRVCSVRYATHVELCGCSSAIRHHKSPNKFQAQTPTMCTTAPNVWFVL